NVPFVPVSSNPIAIELASPQYSDGELRVSLQASVTSREGVVREVRWQQIYGPEAVIVDPYSAETSVWLPWVTQPARLGFRFAAVNSEGIANSASTHIVALPLEDAALSLSSQVLANEIELTIALPGPTVEDLLLTVSVEDVSG